MTLIERVEREGSVDIGIVSAEAMGEYVLELANNAPHLELLWESADGETGNVTIRKTTIVVIKKENDMYFTSIAIATTTLRERYNTPYVTLFAPMCEDGSALLQVVCADAELCEMYGQEFTPFETFIVTLKSIGDGNVLNATINK